MTDELIEETSEEVEVVEEVAEEETPKRKPRAKKETVESVDSELAEVNEILASIDVVPEVWWVKERLQLGGRSAKEAWEAGDKDAVWKMVR